MFLLYLLYLLYGLRLFLLRNILWKIIDMILLNIPLFILFHSYLLFCCYLPISILCLYLILLIDLLLIYHFTLFIVLFIELALLNWYFLRSYRWLLFLWWSWCILYLFIFLVTLLKLKQFIEPVRPCLLWSIPRQYNILQPQILPIYPRIRIIKLNHINTPLGRHESRSHLNGYLLLRHQQLLGLSLTLEITKIKQSDRDIVVFN